MIHVLASLEQHAIDRPDALAYAFEGARLSYRQLFDEAQRWAVAFDELGLDRGDRCAIVLPVGVPLVRAIFALQAIGAAPVIMSPVLDEATIIARARKVGARVIVADNKLVRDSFEGVRVVGPSELDSFSTLGLLRPLEIALEITAFVQITSGTTKEARPIAINHAHIASYLRGAAELAPLRDDDVFVTWTPPHHELGLVRFILAPMVLGRPSFLLEPSLAGMKKWLATIERERATITGAPDFGYRFLNKSVDANEYDLSSLRFATNGGEPVRRSTIRIFEEKFGVPGVIRPGYGLAEATLTVASTKLGESVVADARGHVACGRPIRGVEVRIEGLERGNAGPISIRGDSIAGASDPGAWFATADYGAVDADGRVYVHGRTNAMLQLRNRTIAPRELEEPADLFPEVRASAAIEENGEALVLIEADRTASEDLCARIEAELEATSGVHARVLTVPPRTIPKTASGKLQYGELRSRVWSPVRVPG